MGKKSEAEQIREYLQEHTNATNSETIEALAAKGVDIKSGQVSRARKQVQEQATKPSAAEKSQQSDASDSAPGTESGSSSAAPSHDASEPGQTNQDSGTPHDQIDQEFRAPKPDLVFQDPANRAQVGEPEKRRPAPTGETSGPKYHDVPKDSKLHFPR